MIIGVPRETFPGERRVALVPPTLPALKKTGAEIIVESDAGQNAGFPDSAYIEKGARIAASRLELYATADIILQVRTPGANPVSGAAELPLLKSGQTLIGFSDPLTDTAVCPKLAELGVTLFALELIPRITRAQSMDVLSSMATIAGYKAVLLAANTLPRMFPVMMTAAGTIAPSKVFVIGAGVAGLQAIASAKRLGAVVKAYDVRPAVKEQIESVGATFVELPLETKGSEDKGGYAKAQDEDFYRRQREMMAKVLSESDVAITTAAIPGKRAPILITAEMVKGMAPGSVIVDLAAERGGNCELTRPGETIEVNGVTIIGELNLPSTIPYHASQMYSKNIVTFLAHLLGERGALTLNLEDEITRETLVTHEGNVVQPRVRELLGLPALELATV